MKLKSSALQRVTSWCHDHPEVADYLDALNQNGVHWAIYSGTAVNLLTGARETADLDIVVTPDDLPLAVGLAPSSVTMNNADPRYICGDCVELDFPACGATFELGGLQVDLMATGPARYGNHTYRPGISQLALDNRLCAHVDDKVIFIANPFDTIALKSILQRGRPQKHDMEDIVALVTQYPLNIGYAAARSKEVNLDSRAFAFLEESVRAITELYLDPLQPSRNIQALSGLAF